MFPIHLHHNLCPVTTSASGTKTFLSLPLPDFRVWGIGVASRPGDGGGYIFDTGNEGRRLLWDVPLVKNLGDDVTVDLSFDIDGAPPCPTHPGSVLLCAEL